MLFSVVLGGYFEGPFLVARWGAKPTQRDLNLIANVPYLKPEKKVYR
jgi:hypothetical protein